LNDMGKISDIGKTLIENLQAENEKLKDAIKRVRVETSKPEYSLCMISDLDEILSKALKEQEKET